MEPQPPSRKSERVFLGSFLYLYRCLVLAHAISFPILWLISSHRDPLTILFSILAAAILDLPMALLLMWFYRVRVASDGIHGGTVWGTPVHMTWAEMETVQPRKLLGLPYLKVTSFRKKRPALWIPRFLGTPKAFQEHISHQTSSINPLRKSLEEGGEAASRAPAHNIQLL